MRQPLPDTNHKKLSQQSATTDCYTTHQSKVSCISDTFITKFGARYCFYTCLSFCSRGGGGFPVCITASGIWGGVSFSACITGHMTGGPASRGLGRPPPSPQSDTTGYGQQALGTHANGMYSF